MEVIIACLILIQAFQWWLIYSIATRPVNVTIVHVDEYYEEEPTEGEEWKYGDDKN